MEDSLVVFSWVSTGLLFASQSLNDPLKLIAFTDTILVCIQTQYGLGHAPTRHPTFSTLGNR